MLSLLHYIFIDDTNNWQWLKWLIAIVLMAGPFIRHMFILLSNYHAVVIPTLLDNSRMGKYVDKVATRKFDEEMAKINREALK